MNQIEIFNSPEFGSIRTLEQNGKYYFAVQMWQQRWDIPIHAKPSATIPGVERNVP